MSERSERSAGAAPEPSTGQKSLAAEQATTAEQAQTAEADPRRGRRRWRAVRRVALFTLAGLTALALVAGLLSVWAVRRSFPDYGGEKPLPGLAAEVTVHHDAYGVPRIYARDAADLFRAQGYVHAQERFWEMDFRRHVTAGRLSELFGRGQVETDTFLRTLGWRRVAEREWDIISAESRGFLQAYAEGVNAWLDQHGGGEPSGDVSLEYTVLGLTNRGYRIERWDPVDSLAWLKAMAWDLRGNLSEELERAVLLAKGLTGPQVGELFPPYPMDRHRPIVDGGRVAGGAFVAADASGAGGGWLPALTAVRDGLADLPALLGRGAGLGSNSWVLAGSRTASGKPLLANDPHLGASMPGIWFQAGLHCECGFDLAGFTFAGVPGVVIGHNDAIAWGFTNLGPDVTDLYLEEVSGGKVRVGGGWQDLETREETITVAGGEPVTVTVRTSANGPLLSDASEEVRAAGGRHAVALRWTALDPGRTIDALFALNRARDWAGFRAAAALFEVPAQNLVYADVAGNIGYQAPGRIPVRGKGDGRVPAPGWDTAYRWASYIPFAELPSVLNPAQGYIVTANQAVVGPSYPYLLTHDWSYGYRSERIHQLVEGAGRAVTADDLARMQMDGYNALAPLLVPHLLRVPYGGAARDLLRGWDYQQPVDSAAAAYFNAVWRALLARTFEELPEDYPPDGGDRWWEVVRTLLERPASPWWDDRGTPAVETMDQTLTAALTDATAELTERLGDDPAAWRWGDLHTLELRNQSFGESGVAPVEWLFNRGPEPVPGGSSIVNATGWDAASGYEVDSLPSMRMVVDLGDLDGSRWIQPSGNSGHAFSAHYADQFGPWRRGETLPMRWDPETIRREAAGTLRLRPE